MKASRCHLAEGGIPVLSQRGTNVVLSFPSQVTHKLTSHPEPCAFDGAHASWPWGFLTELPSWLVSLRALGLSLPEKSGRVSADTAPNRARGTSGGGGRVVKSSLTWAFVCWGPWALVCYKPEGAGWFCGDVSSPGTRRAASERRGWRRCSWTRTTTCG